MGGLLLSSRQMRAAAILGLGCSPKNLKPFQRDASQIGQNVDWRVGMPASREDADVILLFGGDGTVHRHLGQLVRLGLPVLIVPAGSGNDFAGALGLRRVRDSLAAWERFLSGHGNLRAIDLGVIAAKPEAVEQVRYFGSVAGAGLDGEVARRANGLPRWLRGRGGYALSLPGALFSFAPQPMKILQENAGKWTAHYAGPTMLAAFANTPLYGGGMKIAPQADMHDGLLDVCVVKALDPFKLFCLFPTVYSGRHVKIRDVEYFKSPRVRVETERPLDIYADGEYVCRTPVEIGVERGVLRVMV